MLIELDYKDRRPIYEQVTEKLASMMMLGVLEENSQLPSCLLYTSRQGKL